MPKTSVKPLRNGHRGSWQGSRDLGRNCVRASKGAEETGAGSRVNKTQENPLSQPRGQASTKSL